MDCSPTKSQYSHPACPWVVYLRQTQTEITKPKQIKSPPCICTEHPQAFLHVTALYTALTPVTAVRHPGMF